MNEEGTGVVGSGNPASRAGDESIEGEGEPGVVEAGQPEAPPPTHAAPVVAWLPEEGEEERPGQTAIRGSVVALALGAVVMIGALALIAATRQGPLPTPAPIVADHNTHSIERLQSDAHAVPVRFVLQTRGAPLVTEVSTNQQCATAQLVQGNRTTPPLSTKASERFAGFQLVPFQPAYLEVSIDPQSHGPNGEVALKHTAQVKTADGQVLSFDVSTGGK